MRFWAKAKAALVGLAFCFAAGAADAADIVAHSARLVADEDGYSLSADFGVSLNRRLENAVNRGVVLYFTVDFELTRSRWYWFDQTVARQARTFQLSYHALTRQYRVASGALHRNFSSLEDALRALSHPRRWRVAGRDDIDADVVYEARVRLRLDPSQMAKPFQVSALSNRDWSQSSDWLAWEFSAPEDAPPERGPANEAGGGR